MALDWSGVPSVYNVEVVDENNWGQSEDLGTLDLDSLDEAITFAEENHEGWERDLGANDVRLTELAIKWDVKADEWIYDGAWDKRERVCAIGECSGHITEDATEPVRTITYLIKERQYSPQE